MKRQKVAILVDLPGHVSAAAVPPQFNSLLSALQIGPFHPHFMEQGVSSFVDAFFVMLIQTLFPL